MVGTLISRRLEGRAKLPRPHFSSGAELPPGVSYSSNSLLDTPRPGAAMTPPHLHPDAPSGQPPEERPVHPERPFDERPIEEWSTQEWPVQVQMAHDWSATRPPDQPQRTAWRSVGFWLALTLVFFLVWLQLPKVYIAQPREIGPNTQQTAFIPYANSGKFGYADPLGKSRIPPRYDGADRFSEGRARVLLNGRFGFIDTSGALVIPARFAWASTFRGGYASVWTGTDWNYLDLEGRELTTFPKHAKPSQTHSL